MSAINIDELFQETLGDTMDDYILPPPSFTLMQCEIVEFNSDEKSIIVKMPVLESFLNPYSTMQGGMIMGAIDNALGPLSMLIAPMNVTRTMESKLLKPITMDLNYIYVQATLQEQKKRRLIFNVHVRDFNDVVYAKATVVNWIIE